MEIDIHYKIHTHTKQKYTIHIYTHTYIHAYSPTDSSHLSYTNRPNTRHFNNNTPYTAAAMCQSSLGLFIWISFSFSLSSHSFLIASEMYRK